MQAVASWGEWFRHWLYDWGGANVDIFLSINRAMPDGLLWLPEALTWLGSYWGAPAVAAVLWLWCRGLFGGDLGAVRLALSRFVVGLALALSSAAVVKVAFAFPRPWTALGESVFRVVGTPDSRYTLPSGHSTYVAVFAAAMWPLLGWPAKATLLAFAAGVGWSRIALGAHFPADVLAGFALGWLSVVAAGPLARRVATRIPGAEGATR
jgi:membrane-associated phospholipid phosphatase|uniref:phosphatase PAP2 family protein n=1 Tax=uncultured Acidovorax sp. TaxID=158751 RepID=UPI0009EC27C1|nr:phosphatase PAP2 family protein [uncultured Acidovorax sp.]